MKIDIEKYKKLREELVCVPSGLIKEDGTDIMAWTLKKYLSKKELEEIENKEKELEQTVSKENEHKNLNNVKEDIQEYSLRLNMNSKHDKLFKQILINKNEAANLINIALKARYKVNSDKLEIYNKEYISKMFEKMETDMVYKIEEKKTYIIIEHQSTFDRSMPFRIIQYKAEILRNTIEKDKFKNVKYKYPRVIAIVLYTGIRKWKIKNMAELQIPLEGYKEEKEEYILIDNHNYKEEKLLESKYMLGKAMLIERQKDENGIIEILKKISKKMKQKTENEKRELFNIILQYVLLSINNKELTEKINKLFKDKKGDENDMLHATKILNEAFDKREEKGKKEEKSITAKKLLSKKMKIEFISEITGLTKEEIESLK